MKAFTSLRDIVMMPKGLSLVILFVTSKCNSKCRTCFYWSSLNQQGDLSFDEMRRLSESMPPFQDLWVSGGEPFMREELAEIIHTFHLNNQVRSVRIPTNGLLRSAVLETTERILKESPGLDLEIDFSLDGFSSTHDHIRGVPGGFEKTIETIGAIHPLRDRNKRLTIKATSVICAENYSEIPHLGQLLLDNYDLDGHYFEVVRGDPMDPSLKGLSPEALAKVHREVLPINDEYTRRQMRRGAGLWKSVRSAWWMGGHQFVYETQERNFASKEPWKMNCSAGLNSVVIDYNGDVRICELRKPIGNLRNYGMDFGRFWDSMERRRERAQMLEDKCFCTHMCFIYDSVRHSRRAIFFEIPVQLLKRSLAG